MSSTSFRPWGALAPDLVADLGAVLGPRAGQVVAEVVAGVAAGVPELGAGGGSKPDRDLAAAVEAAVARFLELLGTDHPALTPAVAELYVALGAAEARELRGPDALMAAVRVSARVLLRSVVGVLSERRPAEGADVVDLSEAVSAFADELAAAATEGFARQLGEQASESGRRRQRLAELFLRGGAAPAHVASACTAVGWPAPGRLVVVRLPLDEARDARFRFSADGLVAERDDAALLLVRDGPRAGRRALEGSLRGRGAVVAPPVAWPDVPRAVHLADRTAAVVAVPAGPVAVTFVADHLLALALGGEPGALDLLAARRLAPFDGLGPLRRERLLGTLHAWLRHWGARPRIAQELGIHPQTVSYRIGLVRDLLGDALDDPDVRVELLAVLADRRHPGSD